MQLREVLDGHHIILDGDLGSHEMGRERSMFEAYKAQGLTNLVKSTNYAVSLCCTSGMGAIVVDFLQQNVVITIMSCCAIHSDGPVLQCLLQLLQHLSEPVATPYLTYQKC